MSRILAVIILFCINVFSYQPACADIAAENLLQGNDRILILAPHPDDETIGLSDDQCADAHH